MLNVILLLDSGLKEDHAHAFRDTAPLTIGYRHSKKKQQNGPLHQMTAVTKMKMVSSLVILCSRFSMH